jgi:hypothetical protein
MTENTPETSFLRARSGRVSLLVATGLLIAAVALPPIAGATAPPPSIDSPTFTSVLRTSAVLGGNVTSDNGNAITERGIVYALTSNNANPVIGGSNVTKVTTSGTTGVFTTSVTGLTGGSGYSFAAYATNSAGTTYTTPVSTFTTPAFEIAVASNSNPSRINEYVTFTADVVGAGPTGTVTFSIDGSLTSAITLTTIDANTSRAVYVANFETVGNRSVFATYNGNLGSGSSSSITQNTLDDRTVATTTTLSASASPVSPGTSVTFTATLTSSAGSPLGVVNFYSQDSASGFKLLASQAAAASGTNTSTAAFSTTTLPSGDTTVFANFVADTPWRMGVGSTTVTVGSLPTVATPTSTEVSGTSVKLGGTATSDGGSVLQLRGVVYAVTGLNNDPTIGGTAVSVASDEAADCGLPCVFVFPISGLSPDTEYSFKAFATNSIGTAYTSVGTFRTTKTPTVDSPTVSNVAFTRATLGGTVTDDGDGDSGINALTERGVVYALTTVNGSPTLDAVDSVDTFKVVASGTTIDSFTASASGLLAGGAYSFRAYATSSTAGLTQTGYSAVGTFTTGAVSSPTATSVRDTSATLGGTVTVDDGSLITDRGIVYSETSANQVPEIGGIGVIQVSTPGTTGTFTVPVTGLTAPTEYSFAAYATTCGGTTYSPVSTFTTVVLPTVTTPTSGSVTGDSAILGGDVTSDGGGAITERGVVISLTSTNNDPVISGSGVTKIVVSGTTGVFTASATGLAVNSQYSYKAYATNIVGTTYTTVATFSTPPVPTVTSPTSAAVTSTTATLGGNVTSDSGVPVSERGVVFSLTSANGNPLVGGVGVTKVTASGTLGTFTAPVAGLTQGSAYSFRAYATNSAGTTYTSVATFTTLVRPTITSPTSASIVTTSASLGGNVTSDNGSSITERGVVYALTSVNSNPENGGTGVTKAATTGTTGVFTVSVSGLTNGAAYSFKAYATSAAGTSYTSAATFTTLTAPTLGSATASGSSASTVTLDSSVSSDGGSPIIERGFVYSATATNSNPALSGTGVTKITVSGTTGAYSSGVFALTAGTAYSFKAYAASAGGIGYSSTGTFTTSNPTFSIGDVFMNEGNSGTQTYSFVVTLSNASSLTATVAYATQNGTATAGQDFTMATGTLTFAPGQTSQTVDVSVSGDTTPEADETFTMALANATNATIVRANGSGVILNDDGGVNPPGLSVAAGTVAEGHIGESLVSFQVSLSAVSTTDVTVTYATTDGTATAGADYTSASGSFTIPAGHLSKNVVVVVKGDQTIEPNETFLLTLSNPTGATLLNGTAIGTITNDDPVPASATVFQYRLYHEGTKEHLFTTDKNEYDTLGTRGWTQEGIAYRMLTSGIYGGVITVPLFRVYHPGILQHHWTTDLNEAIVLSGTTSWFYEIITGYILPTQAPGTVPLYRLSLPSPPLHHLTVDQNEYDTLGTRGWIKEGIMGYVVPSLPN